MTLILTYITPEWVVQACDCRISYKSPKIYDDFARKILFYVGHDAKLSITYTGLANFCRTDGTWMPVEAWLGQHGPDLAASAESVPDFGLGLMKAAAAAVRTTVELEPRTDARLSLVIAGFIAVDTPPGAIVVSNFQRGGYRLPLASGSDPVPVHVPAQVIYESDGFEYTVLTKSSGAGLLIHGDHTALAPPTSVEVQHALQDELVRRRPEGVRDVLVAAIKGSARQKPSGTVSADCWSRIAWRDQNIELFDSHFEDPNRHGLSPMVVGPGLRMQPLLVSGAPNPTVEAIKVKLDAGLLVQRIDEPTLIAFLDWSPRLATLIAAVHRSGVSISNSMYYVGDLLTVVRLAFLGSVATLEQHISQAHEWADRMIHDMIAERADRMGSIGQISVDRPAILAYLLVAIRPDHYPTTAPPDSFAWPITQELIEWAKRYNPKYRS